VNDPKFPFGKRAASHPTSASAPARPALDVAGLVAELLPHKEELLSAIIDRIPVMITIYEPNTKVLHLNAEFERIVGWTNAEAAGVSLMEACYPDPIYRHQVAKFMEECSERWMDIRMRTRYGHDIETTWANIRLSDGIQVGIGIDITDRKRADHAVRESEARLQTLADAVPAMVWSCDPEGRAVYMNRRWYEYTGQSAEASVGFTWVDTVHCDDVARVLAQWQHSRDTGEPYETELRYRRSDGNYRWHHVRALPAFDAEGRIERWYGCSVDVHDIKVAAEVIAAGERRFAAAFRLNPVPMGILTLDGRYLEVNDAMAAHSGYSRDEIVGKTTADLKFFVDPDERADYYRILEQEGRVHGFATRLRVASGEVRDCVLSAERIELEGQDCILAVRIDVTERMAAEQRLREADRRKDEFLAMLAHELRNPLAPIRNAAELLRRLDPIAPQARNAVDLIARQAGHMARLVDDLLDVSRVTQGKVTLVSAPVELAATIHAAVELARPLIDVRHHALTLTLPHAPLYVEGDPARLAQIVGNLLNNAAKYTEDGGKIALRLARQGNLACVSVEDNGIGIAPDLLPHVFDLFTQADRSLDRAQGGLGIGLSLVKSLVELHGGSVMATSAGVGRGSTFTVCLPLSSAPPHEQAAAQMSTLAAPRRLLVVDDNVDAAQSIAMLLELQGHTVRTAYDGYSALRMLSDFKPHGVLLDIGLPGMDGFEVARRMRALNEGKSVTLIALTGYGQDEHRRRSREVGFDHHLVKPVEPDALLTLIGSLP